MPFPARPRTGSHRALALIVASLGAVATAQERGFAVHRYDGTEAGSMQFLVERPWGSDVRPFAFGLTVDGSEDPLVPRVATGRGNVTPVISQALVGHVDLAGALFNRLLVSGSLPVALLERGTPELLSGAGPVRAATVGDPRVGVLLRVGGRPDRDGLSMHVGLDAWIPIGAQATHQGDGTFRLQPKAVFAGAFGVGRWALDLGFLLRPYASFGPPALGMTAASEARAGASLGVSLLNDRLSLGPEARFSVQVVGANAFVVEGMSLEVLGGLHVLIADHLLLGIGGGTAFFGAAGTPDARVMMRLAWAPRKPVHHERKPIAVGEVAVQTVALPDGGVERRAVPMAPVATAVDGGVVVAPIALASPDGGLSTSAAVSSVAAPEEDAPEDERDEDEVKREEQAAVERARVEAARLTADADEDGVPDVIDRCPYEPETMNGIRDEDGCPEADLAPGTPLAKVLAAKPVAAPVSVTPATPSATALPSATDAGTPAEAFVTELPDADGDGVPDAMDRCPATPEDLDGFEDQDGCPEPDNDGDGIPDVKDKCPDEAETVNGVDDEDGCPDTAKDSDKDGVADEIDRCPFEPGSTDDGCPRAPLPHAAALASLLEPKPEPATLPAESTALAPTAPAKPELARDSDGDGIPDAADRCPVTPEDKDGFEDDDGCPEPDNDGDGIPDAKDKCPNEAETFNGNADTDGCPDEPLDADGDGVDYEHDRCPLEKGDASDGCPHTPLPPLALPGFPGMPASAPAPESAPPAAAEPAPMAATADLDHDGIPDEADACPMSPEDKDGFEDDDGCPEPDNDHDGIPDAKDKCPLEAETINGIKDDDGCPDVGKGVVTVKGDHVVIDGIVRFKTASANLEKASLPLLQQVASTLKAWASLSIEIQGHTDDAGSAATNVKLSKKRAEAIRAVLVKAGVAPTRLVANGYGPTRPRASNKTAAGREQNRRVEFLILGESQ